MSKLRTLDSAIAELVKDGDSVVMEGFTHLIPFAAGHEIIRQRRQALSLIRLTPDLLFDQMIAAGCCSTLTFSWGGNPGIGSLHALRRAIEHGLPNRIAIDEYSHFGLAMRLYAGAAGLPFMPLRSYYRSDLPRVNDRIRLITCPFTGSELYAVPALHPDVAIVHVQRSDDQGNSHVWGLLGAQREAAFAATRVIVTAEEIVPTSIIRSDPNRTMIPAPKVAAVCHVPFGAHPSYAQGYYDRDNDFYRDWEQVSRDARRLSAWLDEWVRETPNQAAYLEKLGPERLAGLVPAPSYAAAVNYGSYS
jgi:glutaconate CoA-transferase subunit A